MTPFGVKIRQLRKSKGVTLKQMASALGVSSAYLSALENGKRGRPSWYLLQRTINYFNVIWDEAEDIVALARLSHPKISIDTSALSPMATELANMLADKIGKMSNEEINMHLSLLKKSSKIKE